MKTRTLKQAFNTIFHNKDEFADFCNLDIDNEVQEFAISSRSIIKTTDKLKKYLRFINKVILSHLRYNKHVVHSYVKQRNSLTAVREHLTNKYFFVTDIENFFSTVTAEDVEKILATNAEMSPISDLDIHIPLIVKYVAWGGSIPVGFPTSPQLSNAYLYEFDSALAAYCSKHSLIYTRYSDDIIISSISLEAVSKLEPLIQEMLWTYASKNLRINKKKTKVTHIGNKVKILGLIITPGGHVTIDKKYKSTIELLLHFYVTDKNKYLDILKTEFGGKESSIFGLLHYVKSVDPGYLERLQRKYGVYALTSLMEQKESE